MGTCAQCNNTKQDSVESDMYKKHESVHLKLLELNQISKATIFERMKFNKKMEIDQLSDKIFEDSLQISEVNQEITLIQSIHGSLKRINKQYNFQECIQMFNNAQKCQQNESINKQKFRMTDPNLPKNLSNSSSSNNQFQEFNKQFKVIEKQNIEFDDNKSLKSILKKTNMRNCESKSVHFARNTNSSQTQMKSRSCNHSKKKKKKIQQFDNYKF
ncbi:unnamed protein product [Paramecium pentaurelia]|uniref:Uncharacterized protein n=1 Tax=Paramecium pentaurelia TaxID=43138 RepID=A0A8S1WUL4_9CILI|nr:unnamed protein product [Paramecium pentaurelia]